MIALIQTPYSSWMIWTSTPIFLSCAAITWAPATIVGKVGITFSVVLKPVGNPASARSFFARSTFGAYHSLNSSAGSAHGRMAGVRGPVTEPRPEAAAWSTSARSTARLSACRTRTSAKGFRPWLMFTMSKPSRGERSTRRRLSSFTSR